MSGQPPMTMQQSQAMAQQAAAAAAAQQQAAAAAAAQQQAQQDPKQDLILQTKQLVAKLKATLAETMKTAAQAINYNGKIDNGTLKPTDQMGPEFVKNLEKFLSICDLIELNLRTSLECSAQMAASQRYTPLPVSSLRSELQPASDALTYNQYIGVVRKQIQTADEVRTMLQELAQPPAPAPAEAHS